MHETRIRPFWSSLTVATVCALSCGISAVRTAASDQPPTMERVDLFDDVRIPNIVVTTDGTVLAFAKSGRLVRRSEDHGRTWSPVQEVGHDASGSAIVDTNTSDVLVVDSRNGHLWRSRDQGKTWRREEIVVKPNAHGYGTPDGTPVQTTCSESGLTLQFGEHAGRLLMPARVMAPVGSNDQPWWPYHYNTAIYSDDGGKSWQTSAPVQSGTGEGTLAELSSGDIYLLFERGDKKLYEKIAVVRFNLPWLVEGSESVVPEWVFAAGR